MVTFITRNHTSHAHTHTRFHIQYNLIQAVPCHENYQHYPRVVTHTHSNPGPGNARQPCSPIHRRRYIKQPYLDDGKKNYCLFCALINTEVAPLCQRTENIYRTAISARSFSRLDYHRRTCSVYSMNSEHNYVQAKRLATAYQNSTRVPHSRNNIHATFQNSQKQQYRRRPLGLAIKVGSRFLEFEIAQKYHYAHTVSDPALQIHANRLTEIAK